MIQEKISLLIDNGEEDMFLTTIASLSSQELGTLSFDFVDSKLEAAEDFSLKHKLIYAFSFRRPLYDRLCAMILSNPHAYPYDAVMYLAFHHSEARDSLFRCLFVRSVYPLFVHLFQRELTSAGVYDSFLSSIFDGDDIGLKLHYVLYFDSSAVSMLFGNFLGVAHAIVEIDNYNDVLHGRSDALLQLSKIAKDRETLCYIQEHLTEVVQQEQKQFLDMCFSVDDAMSSAISEKMRDKLEESQKLRLAYCTDSFERNTKNLL